MENRNNSSGETHSFISFHKLENCEKQSKSDSAASRKLGAPMLVNPRSIVCSMESCVGAIELTVATKPKTMEKVMSSEKLVAGGEREQ